MIYKSLNFKLVLVLVLFIICVIVVIGTIMLNSVFDFYIDEFTAQMEANFASTLLSELKEDMDKEDFYKFQKEKLDAYAGQLGIDGYRDYYILDMDGNVLESTKNNIGEGAGNEPKPPAKTANLLAAMNKRRGTEQVFGSDYMDYAVYLNNEGAEVFNECIIYIYDTQEEMKKFTWKLFTIIIQSLLIALIIAIILSFFLANAITAPIKNITRGAKKISDGDFEKELEVISNDEIGILTSAFNNMSDNLKNKIDEVSGEREKLETIFVHLKDGVFAFSADGLLLHINPQGNELLKADFSYDNNFYDLMKLLNIKTDIKTVEEKNNILLRDVVHYDSYFDVNIGRFRYKEDKKNKDGIIVVIQDITQRYSLEKSRREFIANVSHELNTPLASIRGAAETILINEEISSVWKNTLLNMVLNNSDRMKRIIDDLLVISRLDNKKMMWKFVHVDVSAMVENIFLAMQTAAKKNAHEFVLDAAENLNGIYADRERIEQVLTNVISNAFKYTPNGGKITFGVKNYTNIKSNLNYKGIKFTIKDTGIGIPKEDLPHIFERFYRVEKARSTEAGGTGLGLSIAKEMVLAHKGHITIDSEINKGTTVVIILPSLSEEDMKESEENIITVKTNDDGEYDEDGVKIYRG